MRAAWTWWWNSVVSARAAARDRQSASLAPRVVCEVDRSLREAGQSPGPGDHECRAVPDPVAIASCAPASSTRAYELSDKSTSVKSTPPLNCYYRIDAAGFSRLLSQANLDFFPSARLAFFGGSAHRGAVLRTNWSVHCSKANISGNVVPSTSWPRWSRRRCSTAWVSSTKMAGAAGGGVLGSAWGVRATPGLMVTLHTAAAARAGITGTHTASWGQLPGERGRGLFGPGPWCALTQSQLHPGCTVASAATRSRASGAAPAR